MDERYALSICMMVKNEEKNLKRCLDSLKLLLSKPDVELIIVDTGSTDKTIDIATQYTSKVYFNPWNNNFSDMRNITISYAKGERILILDADEVLVDASKLYELVKDPRFQEYNTFMLKFKSFIGPTHDFTILSQERVFRNDGEFRYEGAVHNQPVFKSPILSTDICCEHFGYMSNDREMLERKFKRTSTILLEELEKNPESIYYRYQLAKSYDAYGEHRKALCEIRKAYDLAAGDIRRKVYLFGEYALICIKSIEYEEAIKICAEGIVIEPDYLDLYYMTAEACQKLGRNQEAFDAYSKYLVLLEKYDKLDISHNRSVEMLFVGDSFKDAALTFIINRLMENRMYTDAEAYALYMNDEKVKSEFLFKIYLKLKEYEKSYELYIRKLDNSEINDMFTALAEDEKKTMPYDESKAMEKQFSKGEDKYSLLNRIRIYESGEIKPLLDQLTKIADLNELPDFYSDVFITLYNKSKLLLSYMRNLKKSKVRSYAKRLMDLKHDFRPAFEDYLVKEPSRRTDFNNLKLHVGLSFAVLFNEAANIDKDNIDISPILYDIFKNYLNDGIAYVSLLYNTERLRLYYNSIDEPEDRFFLIISYAQAAVEKGDYKSGIRYFSEAVRANPYMSCYLMPYKQELFSALDI